MRWRGLLIGMMSVSLGCSLFGGGRSSGGESSPVESGPRSALSGRVGEVLELSIPLLEGGVQDLAELRGRPVLLEMADAQSPQREPSQARYRALVEQESDGPVVVSVALDPQTDALPAAWTDDRPPFVLGWDPQGALAARLGLVTLPTVVLLDDAGVIVAVHEGTPPDDVALGGWLHPGS